MRNGSGCSLDVSHPGYEENDHTDETGHQSAQEQGLADSNRGGYDTAKEYAQRSEREGQKEHE